MKSYTLKLFLLLAVASLFSCGGQPIKSEKEKTDTSKPATEKQVTLGEEAERLLELAEDSNTETEQFKYRGLAAYHYIEAGEINRARKQLEILKEKQQKRPAIDETSAQIETATVLILSAEIAIYEKDATLASQLISEIKAITQAQQIKFYELKADLDFLLGKYMYTVDRRVKLDDFITDAEEKKKNDKKIWIAVSSLSTAQLNNQRSSNKTIEGWLDLAKVVRSGQNSISKFEDDLLDWGTRYPSHSANDTFLQELITLYQNDVSEKKHIAVILPMQGDLSKITSNIKNGILSAYYRDSNTSIKPDINFYDSSNENFTFNQLYQQAINNGATNIIGPLDKIDINQLAQKPELDIPVLTLNYAENAFNNTENLFQFGLSPEDEAHQVAELAIQQNKKYAAVFYPDSEWGQRLSRAFRDHYTSLGGKVITLENYATDTNDYSRPIRALFNLDQSSIRHRKVENIISRRAINIPYRRQDIDMIFLAATPRSARSIMPAFKFHHASGLPVYSTSHVYTGKPNKELDRDLNGLIFCDLPWVLQNNSPLEKVFTQNWPQQENYTRLFALGIDAYQLIYNLDYLENKDFAFYDGQTGNIQLDENNRITRKLLWAKFKRGKPVYFEPTPVEPELTAPKPKKLSPY
ncbi:Penicillin-binding protein activator LpoA [hydrothermal vent metagenome]|uniref:Penicillin-binding protein activator LpoA n=1 Tax=hydrothermal vent metagenome TaxID=652676 RepID=A0A3B0XE06_9ZZZZ